MRWSNVVPNTLGVLLGLLIVGAGVGGLSFLVLEQLSRSPAKPSFPEVKKTLTLLTSTPMMTEPIQLW
ncbi:MAG: hypothetical protein HC852_10255 [Acaryochloridaceae cyanobacterium RU_4_10]|nr:hypothetical protein [Acaryochloridaceae cyanobacterium RU_4_10]